MTSIQSTKEKVFFANLDGLRFFAFLSVFLSHCFHFMGYSNSSKTHKAFKHIFVNGHLGVSFFFVISGFLITYLLFKELAFGEKIRVNYFYFRRVLRIWPLYILILILGFFIVPQLAFITEKQSLLHLNLTAPIERLPWYALFSANFDLILNGEISLVVAILWSVSVEEQFYLVWPLLLNRINPIKADKVFYAIILLSFIYRCIYWDSQESLRFSTMSVMSDLCVGALIAYYVLYRPSFKERIVGLKKWQIIGGYCLGVALIPLRGFSHFFGELVYRAYIPFESLIFTAFFAFIILEQNFSVNSFFKIGRSAIMSYLGRISYGLYCFHMLATLLCISVFIHFNSYANHPLNFCLLVVSTFLFTVLLAMISFVVIEKRLINFKENFSLFKK